MKKIWLNIADSFASAEKFDRDYYLKMSPVDRLGMVQFLRESYFKFKKEVGDEAAKGLQRVITIKNVSKRKQDQADLELLLAKKRSLK